MTVQEAMQILQDAPIEDRIEIIELLIQSLKQDIPSHSATEKSEPFKVRTFNLGSDIHVDRDKLYLSRGL